MAEPVLPETCSIACKQQTSERKIFTVSLMEDAPPSRFSSLHGGRWAVTGKLLSG